jgi:pSer/pThr/pTyr-binding forkhead associated (FHA) protein
MPRLVVIAPDKSQRTFELTQKLTTIGRMPACAIQIDDKVASRKHCVIKADGDVYRLIDMGSANGTEVNGAKVKEWRLTHDDRITIGNTVLVFKEEPHRDG